MTYDFWDYFWGALILAVFFVPVIAGVLINILVVFVGILSFLFGGGQTRSRSSSSSMTDYEEDEYR